MNFTFAVVDSTGEPRRELTLTDPSDLELNVFQGELVVSGPLPQEDSWYDAENFAWVVKPPRTSDVHVWNPQAKEWADPRTLSQIQGAKWAEIKEAREASKVSPLLDTPFGIFDADALGAANIKDTLNGLAALALLGSSVPTIEWTLADNTAVSLTHADLATVGALLLQRTNDAYEIARVLRERIYAATTPEEVQAVVWPL